MGSVTSKEDANGNDKKITAKNGSIKKSSPKISEKERAEILGDKPEELSPEEKIIIRKTWKDVEQSVAKVGVVMFIK